jgi:hypothetical protein
VKIEQLASWVWDPATVISEDTRRDLLAFAQSKRIDLLFVDAAPIYDTVGGFAALAALHQAAAEQGAAIAMVAGDPSWVMPSHHAQAVAQIDRAARMQARLAGRGVPRSGRLLVDVEPYLLPAWRVARERTAADYDRLVSTLQTAAHRAGLQIWHTIPYWFREVTVDGQPLDDRVLAASDGVVVMAYRSQPSAVRDVAEPVVERAARHGRGVIVAVETTRMNPPEVSFCGRPGIELTATLERLAMGFAGRPGFAGLGVHSYPGWVRLDAGGHTSHLFL